MRNYETGSGAGTCSRNRNKKTMFKHKRLIDKTDELLKKQTGINKAYQKYIGKVCLEELFATDAIYLSAVSCAQGFMDKKDTRKFMKNVWLNVHKLQKKVLSGSFVPTYRQRRIISERGKLREIVPPTFECKVFQKVICTYLIRPLLEPKMISTSYASILGKGTEKMHRDIISCLQKHEKDTGKCIVITDYVSYFASIEIDLLMERLSRYIGDKRIIDLIRMFSPDKYGLPLGNELSQVPASYYPSPVDHFIKDRLGIHEYFRYMDDTLALIDIRNTEMYVKTIISESQKIGLKIHEENIQIIPVGKPFIFCKERYLYNQNKQYYYRIINPQVVRNQLRKLKAYKSFYLKGKLDLEQIEMQFKSVVGNIIAHPNTKKSADRLKKMFAEIKTTKGRTTKCALIN